jgi:hypothetical protein
VRQQIVRAPFGFATGILIAAIAVNATAAVTRIKGYSGAEIPPDQLVVLKTGLGAVIVTVDSEPAAHCGPLKCEVGLSAGLHRLGVGPGPNFGRPDFAEAAKQAQTIELNFNAGHTYTVHALVTPPAALDKPWSIVVSDDTAKSIVYDERQK